MKKKRFSIILILFGRYEVLTKQLKEKIEQLISIKDEVEIIVIADGTRWIAPPMVQMLSVRIPSCRLEVLEKTTHLPAKLLNKGVELAQGEYILFSTLMGTNIIEALNLFRIGIEAEELSKKEDATKKLYHPDVGAFYIHPEHPRQSGFFLKDALYGQCQSVDCLHLDEWCINKSVLDRIGQFNENPLLQCELERFVALALLIDTSLKEAGSMECFRKSL